MFVDRASEPQPLAYVLVTPPAASVIDMAQARRHLRLEEADTDDVEASLIEGAIAAAVAHLDGRTGILNRALVTQTWQATTNRPCRIAGAAWGFLLDLAPIQAVTMIERLIGDGYVEVPAADWRTLPPIGGRVPVVPARGKAWPAADVDPVAWRITFRAGYGAAGETVPAPIRSALLLLIADLFDNRDGSVQSSMVENPTIARLLRPYSRVGV